MILEKAECAGREVVTVRPHYTSQRCAECGHTEASNRISQAEFRCVRAVTRTTPIETPLATFLGPVEPCGLRPASGN